MGRVEWFLQGIFGIIVDFVQFLVHIFGYRSYKWDFLLILRVGQNCLSSHLGGLLFSDSGSGLESLFMLLRSLVLVLISYCTYLSQHKYLEISGFKKRMV